MGEKDRSAVSVVRVCAATEEEAEEDAASSDQRDQQQDVHQSDEPEGEEINSLIAVNINSGLVFHIDWLIYPVHPHITSNEPTEDKKGHEWVPACADTVEGVGGAVFGLCTWQTGQYTQQQAEHPHHHQVDGDVGLPGAILQVHRTNSYLCYGKDAGHQFAAY